MSPLRFPSLALLLVTNHPKERPPHQQHDGSLEERYTLKEGATRDLSCRAHWTNIFVFFVFKEKTINFFFTLLPLIGKMSDTFWLGYQVFRLGLWPTRHSLPWSVSLPPSLAYQSVFPAPKRVFTITSNEAGADHFSKCGDIGRGAAVASWADRKA